MAFQEVTGLEGINSGDKIFKNTITNFIGKVRLEKLPSVNGGEAFSICISQVDDTGKVKLKDNKKDRAVIMEKIAQGEINASDAFIIGEKSTLTVLLSNDTTNLEDDLLTEIYDKISVMETFVEKQKQLELVYADWGI